jgi:hypothetical protein
MPSSDVTCQGEMGVDRHVDDTLPYSQSLRVLATVV